jgi:hypothetical protein
VWICGTFADNQAGNHGDSHAGAVTRCLIGRTASRKRNGVPTGTLNKERSNEDHHLLCRFGIAGWMRRPKYFEFKSGWE